MVVRCLRLRLKELFRLLPPPPPRSGPLNTAGRSTPKPATARPVTIATAQGRFRRNPHRKLKRRYDIIARKERKCSVLSKHTNTTCTRPIIELFVEFINIDVCVDQCRKPVRSR